MVLTYAFFNAKMCFLNVWAIFNMTSNKQKLSLYKYNQKRVLDEKNDPLLTIILQLANMYLVLTRCITMQEPFEILHINDDYNSCL